MTLIPSIFAIISIWFWVGLISLVCSKVDINPTKLKRKILIHVIMGPLFCAINLVCWVFQTLGRFIARTYNNL